MPPTAARALQRLPQPSSCLRRAGVDSPPPTLTSRSLINRSRAQLSPHNSLSLALPVLPKREPTLLSLFNGLILFPQSLLGTYRYVPVEVSEDFPGEIHTKPQNVKVSMLALGFHVSHPLSED